MSEAFHRCIEARADDAAKLFLELCRIWDLSPNSAAEIEPSFLRASTPYRDLLIDRCLNSQFHLPERVVARHLCLRGFWGKLTSMRSQRRGMQFVLDSKLHSEDVRFFDLFEIKHGDNRIPIPSDRNACRALALKAVSIPFLSRTSFTSIGSCETSIERFRVVEKTKDGEILPVSELDIEVAALVRALNSRGMPTVVSCGGHGIEYPHIVFSEPGIRAFMTRYREFLERNHIDYLLPQADAENASRVLGRDEQERARESIRLARCFFRLAYLIRKRPVV